MSTSTSGGKYETSTGTLYISKPYRSRSSKKLRALVTFAPRTSAFDSRNETSGTNEFRGFFSLFWVSIFIFAVQTYVKSFETSGMPLSLDFAAMFSRDAITLAWSDVLLVLTTGICVPFAIALKNNWIQYYWTGLLIQHILQTSILFSAIVWTFNRQWPWVQSGFLTLHSLVMIMKMHSYMTVNGHMQVTRAKAEALLAQLKERVEELTPGTSWDDAITLAQKTRLENERREDVAMGMSRTDSGTSTPGHGTPLPAEAGNPNATSSYLSGRRLAQVVASEPTQPNGSSHPLKQVHSAGSSAVDAEVPSTNGIAETSSASPSKPPSIDFIVPPRPPPPPHPLVHHPNQEIAARAEEYSEVLSDLRSTGPTEYYQWPDTITWKNFAMYQLTPSLVYELEYPRTTKIRPLYVFEKTVATFGTFALLYTVTDRFILPYTPAPGQSSFRSLLDLALPFMIAYLLLFYIIFECICNGFAELAYFADRQFYEDWWNSTSWDEFSRKWNKPVYTFLLRHVYAATILSSYHLSRTAAMLVTFALSAAAHELVMIIVTKKIRMYLFVMQLVQIPMILIGRLPAVKRNKTMGNIVFWLGLYAGFPLLCVAYVAH
ncbi:sterol O-acyltransferase [Ephemerocybe angulata]|uniref:O-acyltransferase n=1 Tax=Ephemerocybe angulata TaxID=980116 RepID=A0A8H6ICC3_9AGAR|nr:sterol O-acyltransferase [Tulosesus angulatus]